MRRSSSFRLAASFAAITAAIGSFAAAVGVSTAAVAPPAKPHPAPAKPPRLSGEVVESEALDLRLVIPDGWAPFKGRIISVPRGAKVVSYNRPKFIPRTALTRYYYPPQFSALSMELPETEKINNLNSAQQDEYMQGFIASIYKSQPNFRFQGAAHVTVGGEPATACAYVNTGDVTGDILKHRIVGMIRNHKLYLFAFVAEVDEFPALSPTFSKILQNFQFLTPRKNDVPPPPAPEVDPPAKSAIL